MGLFRAVLLRHIFRFAFERSEQLVGIRPSTCHPDETGIQFTVRLFRLTGAFLRGILFVDAVPDKKSGTDVKDVMDCIRHGGYLSQLLQILVQLVKVFCRRMGTDRFKDFLNGMCQPCIHF